MLGPENGAGLDTRTLSFEATTTGCWTLWVSHVLAGDVGNLFWPHTLQQVLRPLCTGALGARAEGEFVYST